MRSSITAKKQKYSYAYLLREYRKIKIIETDTRRRFNVGELFYKEQKSTTTFKANW